jgi:hypothetical protein
VYDDDFFEAHRHHAIQQPSRLTLQATLFFALALASLPHPLSSPWAFHYSRGYFSSFEPSIIF